jgi:GAF domain-containing protein
LRQQVDQRLKESNLELERRVRELTTIFAVGKAVISITDQRVLFDKIVEGMVYVAEADYGWLLLREERNRTFVLTSHRNLPENWARKMGQPLEDGVSSLVALSGETLAINGEPLQRFKASSLGKSLVVVPIKVQQEVIGLLVVVRKADAPFDQNMQRLLGAVADYASVSLVNARLFRALKERAEAAQAGEKARLEELLRTQHELHSLLQPVTYPIELLLAGKMGIVTSEQQVALKSIQSALTRTLQLVTAEQNSPLHEN